MCKVSVKHVNHTNLTCRTQSSPCNWNIHCCLISMSDITVYSFTISYNVTERSFICWRSQVYTLSQWLTVVTITALYPSVLLANTVQYPFFPLKEGTEENHNLWKQLVTGPKSVLKHPRIQSRVITNVLWHDVTPENCAKAEWVIRTDKYQKGVKNGTLHDSNVTQYLVVILNCDFNCRENSFSCKATHAQSNGTCWWVGICLLWLATSCVACISNATQWLLPPVPAVRTVVVGTRSFFP